MKFKVTPLVLSLVLAAGCAQESYSSYDYDSGGVYMEDDRAEAVEETYDDPVSLTDSSQEYMAYSYNATIETNDFKQSISDLEQLTSSCNGQIQYESISGSNEKYASFSLLIDAGEFQHFQEELSSIGKIQSSSLSADNLARSYSQVSNEIESLKAQQARLQELMSQAKDLEEILLLEDKLYEVNVELKNYSDEKDRMDQQIDYTTVSIYLVQSPAQAKTQNFGDRLEEAFENSGSLFVGFFQGLLLLLVTFWPFLAVAAVITLAAVLLIRKKKKA